jgi:hypothetical protein
VNDATGSAQEGTPSASEAPAPPSAPLIDIRDTPPTTAVGRGGLANVGGTTEKQREWTRIVIAVVLIIYLGGVICMALIAVFAEGVELQRAKDIIGLVLGTLTGLVGTIIGFYFGAQTAKDVQEATQTAA